MEGTSFATASRIILRLTNALSAWLLLLPALAFSQQMPLRYFSQADGLGNLSVTSLAQDKAGYIWVATENGLFRYNGTAFLRYSKEEGLAASAVTALHVDREGRLWVGAYDNLYLKSGKRFIRVMNGDKPLRIWPGQSFASSPDGSILVISDERLYSISLNDGKPQVQPFFSDELIRQQPALKSLFNIYSDSPNSLWMGCDRSLCQYGAQGVKVWGRAQGVPADQWTSILRDGKGRLWAHGGHHIVLLASQAQRFADRSPPGDMLRKIGLETFLAVDAKGSILANSDAGLIRWNDDYWEFFDTRNGLRTGGGIGAVLFDKDGGMWMGARGYGLINWLGYGNWENWSTAQGLPDDVVLSFVRDRNGVLQVGTRSGPAHFQQNERRFVTNADKFGKNNHQWSSLVSDRHGTVWGATYSGLLMRYDAASGTYVQTAKLPAISRMLADRNDRLWLATDSGIYMTDASSPAKPEHPRAGLEPVNGPNSEAILDLCQSVNGDLWFLAERRLVRFDGAHWDNFSLRIDKAEVSAEAMSCASDGGVWLSSGETGLMRASVDKNGIRLSPLDSPVLRDKSVFAVYEDRRGWLWAGTDAGIAVWNKKQWAFFNQNSGLVWNDTNAHVFYEEADGSMWIATSNGASHIRQPELLFSNSPMKIVVEGIRRNGKAVDADAPFSVPWDSSSLNFSLAVLNYHNRDAITFHYRLQGLEKAWSKTDSTEIRYSALEPGHYTLQVVAENSAMQSTSDVTEVPFDIAPRWWQTRLFQAACALLIISAAAAVYRYRVRSLFARQKLMEDLVLKNQNKSKFVADAAHDLRQPMQAIGNLLEAAQHAIANDDSSKGRSLVGLAQAAAQAMRSSFDSVLEISRLESGLIAAEYSTFDVREMMAEAMLLLKPLADERGVRIRTRIADGKQLPVHSDRHLLGRAVYNLLSNAIRYSDPEKKNATVIIGLVSLRDKCRVDIIDNGIGIPDVEQENVFKPFFQLHNPEHDRGKGVGLGLSIVNSIMLLLPDHRIEMRSTEKRGTRFSVKIPRAMEMDSDRAAIGSVDASARADLAGIYVLFVEDDILVRTSTEALFKEYGILYETAKSLDELAKKLPTMERMPDIVLTDFSLSKDHTPVDVIDAVSAEFDTLIPTIVLTGDSKQRIPTQQLQHAVILRKPLSATTLLEEIQRVCPPRSSVFLDA